MSSIRQKRVAESYFHALRNIMCFEMSDEDLASVSVTQIIVTPDLRLAKIYFSLNDGHQDVEQALRGFAKNAKFFRKRLAEEVSLKFAPELKFFYDEGMGTRQGMDALFKQIEEERHGHGQKD